MAKTCPHCQSSDFDIDPARGDTVCTNCGIVLEENTIVSEVNIQENADGSSSVVGQFVSSEGSYKPYLSGFQYGLKTESRQITLNRGKQEIRELASMLNLNRHCIDTAFNFYKMAIAKRLSRGRRIKHIVAACVYMTCRTESTPHLLIDFSDVTQVNVFTLGKTFLTLAKELHINLPVLDPCIYITRFAHRLDFGDKTHEVTITALRLLARMKRDWLHTGRRPSGLCGAALLVAARLHGYSCKLDDIVKVVKIRHDTIRKRLTEFECTPSSKLTINEFMEIDLEAEHDPPAFINNRIKAKLQQLENEPGGIITIENEIGKLSTVIDNKLVKQPTEGTSKQKKNVKEVSITRSFDDNNDRDPDLEAASDFVHAEDPLQVVDKLLSPNRKNQDNYNTDNLISTFGPAPTAASLGLNSSVVECMALPNRDIDDKNADDGKLDLQGIDDAEIDTLILSPHECAIKTRIWMTENGAFLKALEEKRELRRLEDEKKGKQKPRKTKTISRKDYYGASRTAGEAIEKLMLRQKLSNKINYEALRKVTEEDLKEPPQSPAPVILKEVPVKSNLKRKNSSDVKIASKKPKPQVAFLNFIEKQQGVNLMEPIIEKSNDLPPPAIADEYDNLEDEEEEEEESCLSVSQLLRNSGLNEGGYGEDVDELYDYD